MRRVIKWNPRLLVGTALLAVMLGSQLAVLAPAKADPAETAPASSDPSTTSTTTTSTTDATSTADPTSTTSTTAPVDTTSLLVKLVPGLSASEQQGLIARNGGTETSTIALLRLHVVAVASDQRQAVTRTGGPG